MLFTYQKLKKDQGNAKSAIGANRERQDWKFLLDFPEENYFKMQQFSQLAAGRSKCSPD